MSSFDELVEAQSITHMLISKILPGFNKLAKPRRTVTAIQSRLKCLQQYWDTCQANHLRMRILADEERQKTQEYFVKDKFMLINDAFEETRDSLSELLESMQPRTALFDPDESQAGTSKTLSVHLPRIDIPKFTGDFSKWETFRDMFESLIANRADLSNVQKLHYLKANLVGDASLVLSNFHVTDANYQTAWELLCKR